MASAYVFEYLSRLPHPALRLWLPSDPMPEGICAPAARGGVFEALYDDSGARALAPGTWVGVTGLPSGYDAVALDTARSVGVLGIASPLRREPGCKRGSGCFGIVLERSLPGRHRLAVRFSCARDPKAAPLLEVRDFDVFRVDTGALPPMSDQPGRCDGPLVTKLEHVPLAVMEALEPGPAQGLEKRPSPLVLAPAARGIARLGRFVRTGCDRGELELFVAETPDDVHVLALTAHAPDGRSVTAAGEPFFFQTCPRVVLRGPAAGRSLAAEPPALFRIGPFDGMVVGDAELVHAAFGDLRRTKRPYKGKPWSFQLRVQPYRTGSGKVNLATPRVVGGELETTEGGDLGVVVAADAAHPHLAYALVEKGTLGPRRPLLRASNPLVPADGTFPELRLTVRGAGVEETLSLPEHAVVFFLDEHELTSAETGLLRKLDVAPDHAGTALVMAVHALGPCGCVSRLVLEEREPELHIVTDLAMERAHG